MKHSKLYSIMMVLFMASLSCQLSAQIQNADVHEFPAMKQMKSVAYRYNINIPNIDGYQTLKCDFHMHTVFSDGHVWPTMRVIEAWTDGLDAIAITDHVESKNRKNQDILQINLNKSSDIAIKQGNEMGMIVIRGAEITRKKPLGHINALFLQDVSKLDVPNELDAINAAFAQGAFIQWNHPGWPNDTSTLYPIHEELIAQHKLMAAEVFNGSEYYPKVLDWCDKYGLNYMANTDLHYASANSYREKLQRPMTLVFAKERSAESIREALFAGRTLAFFNGYLAGKEGYLKEIVNKSLSVKVINKEKGIIEISNQSDIPFDIRFGKFMYSVPVFGNQTLRIEMPSGTEVTFTNCMIRQDKQLTLKLW